MVIKKNKHTFNNKIKNLIHLLFKKNLTKKIIFNLKIFFKFFLRLNEIIELFFGKQ